MYIIIVLLIVITLIGISYYYIREFRSSGSMLDEKLNTLSKKIEESTESIRQSGISAEETVNNLQKINVKNIENKSAVILKTEYEKVNEYVENQDDDQSNKEHYAPCTTNVCFIGGLNSVKKNIYDDVNHKNINTYVVNKKLDNFHKDSTNVKIVHIKNTDSITVTDKDFNGFKIQQPENVTVGFSQLQSINNEEYDSTKKSLTYKTQMLETNNSQDYLINNNFQENLETVNTQNICTNVIDKKENIASVNVGNLQENPVFSNTDTNTEKNPDDTKLMAGDIFMKLNEKTQINKEENDNRFVNEQTNKIELNVKSEKSIDVDENSEDSVITLEPIEHYNIHQLKKLAKEYGFSVTNKSKKTELYKLIKNYFESQNN